MTEDSRIKEAIMNKFGKLQDEMVKQIYNILKEEGVLENSKEWKEYSDLIIKKIKTGNYTKISESIRSRIKEDVHLEK